MRQHFHRSMAFVAAILLAGGFASMNLPATQSPANAQPGAGQNEFNQQ
jgi:hypothetical protein